MDLTCFKKHTLVKVFLLELIDVENAKIGICYKFIYEFPLLQYKFLCKM